MRALILLVLLMPSLLFSGSISAPLLEVDGDTATVRIDRTSTGVSGFIVHHFNSERSSILANAIVKDYDQERGVAILELSDYTGLRQNSLPDGRWRPQVGDEAVLGFAYSRALLLAPSDEIYHTITSRVPALEWAHPDTFAAFLSYRGHPTPLKEDFSDFCTVTSSGLLYIQLQESLFTLDCKSLHLLQVIPVDMPREDVKLPFYFRFDKIREAWWGEGSDELTDYDPYYLHLIARHNADNHLFEAYVKAHKLPPRLLESHWYDGFFDLFASVDEDDADDDKEAQE